MTDNEIVKALECLAGEEVPCKECAVLNIPFPSCKERVARCAIDLISRQKTEIDRLIEQNARLNKERDHYIDFLYYPPPWVKNPERQAKTVIAKAWNRRADNG